MQLVTCLPSSVIHQIIIVVAKWTALQWKPSICPWKSRKHCTAVASLLEVVGRVHLLRTMWCVSHKNKRPWIESLRCCVNQAGSPRFIDHRQYMIQHLYPWLDLSNYSSLNASDQRLPSGVELLGEKRRQQKDNSVASVVDVRCWWFTFAMKRPYSVSMIFARKLDAYIAWRPICEIIKSSTTANYHLIAQYDPSIGKKIASFLVLMMA